MESWPTLVLDSCRESSNATSRARKSSSNTTIQLLGNTHLGDLFDMLLPMLSIYQEYVRNHHYSLQVLAECKQNQHFAAFLNRLENRPQLQGRTLETFLTYPMHQIPRYIITLHELLAHTPHNHVERKSLDHARMQLEDLSRQMHDEVSETENIRKNLAIERMIVEGCDILLDVNQMFVRQGKKPSTSNTLSSCFPKEAVPHFPRRSIDFPRKTTDLFTSEDGEEVGATPRSQRSHSTVSYLSREQQLAAIGSRRRLSSLRQSSLGNATTGVAGLLGVASSAVASASPASVGSVVPQNAGASLAKQTAALATAPVSPPFTSISSEGRRLSDAPKIRKKSVRISDESFDECEEIAASTLVTTAGGPSVFTSESTPPNSSPEDKKDEDGHYLSLAPVEEKNSLDSIHSKTQDELCDS